MSNTFEVNGSWTSTFAAWSCCVMFLWISFLIYDFHKRPGPPSFLEPFKLFGHIWLALLFWDTSKMADRHHDPWLLWFIFFLTFRHYRTVVSLYFTFRYKPTIAPADFDLNHNEQCTVIVATVGSDGNDCFADMVCGIFCNNPARVIFSCNSSEACCRTKEVYKPLRDAWLKRETSYQKKQAGQVFFWGSCYVRRDYENVDISLKREQIVKALKLVDTGLTVLVDDTAVWHPKFLAAALSAFADTKVGIVGTCKWVERLSYKHNASQSSFKNASNAYVFGFWNTMGGIYLQRHNFEARATNTADGGIFTVSGRTLLVRSSIVQDPIFQHTFTNEHILEWFYGGFGPVLADDDNFVTRWVVNHGWDVKFQHTPEATMITVLGKDDRKRYMEQCKRWSRTTFRQNPVALFVDRTIWWKWPATVWTTYFPWMYNASLFWDLLLLFVFTGTGFYKESAHRGILLTALLNLIWATKLIKLLPWFLAHPVDFFLYLFPIPAYPLFACAHSLLKCYTMLTFWDLRWSGRKLPPGMEPRIETPRVQEIAIPKILLVNKEGR